MSISVYVCEECGSDDVVDLGVGKHTTESLSRRCGKCGFLMIVDEISVGQEDIDGDKERLS